MANKQNEHISVYNNNLSSVRIHIPLNILAVSCLSGVSVVVYKDWTGYILIREAEMNEPGSVSVGNSGMIPYCCKDNIEKDEMLGRYRPIFTSEGIELEKII